MIKLTPIAALCAGALLLGGCSTTADIKRLDDAVQKAQATADKALQRADEALKTANEAKQVADHAAQDASDAKSTADKAMQEAQAAKDEAGKATTRAERMFKKSMSK